MAAKDLYGEDTAWRLIYVAWRRRAKENEQERVVKTEGEMCIGDWKWESFKNSWVEVAAYEGEKSAWRLLHFLWQKRAGEENTS